MSSQAYRSRPASGSGRPRRSVGAVVRHDGRVGRRTGPGRGSPPRARPPRSPSTASTTCCSQTGERLHFSFGPREPFVAWWRAALAGRSPRLPRGAGCTEAAPIAGLILYRHGGRLSTVHSGDDPESAQETPGALHLLRWRAIQLAIREGCSEMDLGGVDVAGSRGEPHEGDPLYGLYQHKQSFGGQWLELTGAHERVFDPSGYRIGRLAGRAARLVGR